MNFDFSSNKKVQNSGFLSKKTLQLLWLTFDDFLIFINLFLRWEIKIYLMCEMKTHKSAASKETETFSRRF